MAHRSGDPPFRRRALTAGAGGQHQRLRPRSAHEHHGRQGGAGSFGVSPGASAGPAVMRGVLQAAAAQFGWKAASRPAGAATEYPAASMAKPMWRPRPRSRWIKIARKIGPNALCAPRTWGSWSIPMGPRSRWKAASPWEWAMPWPKRCALKMADCWTPVSTSTQFLSAPKRGGEPAIVCMGGVPATAVYDATGVKMLQLPLPPARVQQALKKSGSKMVTAPKTFPTIPSRRNSAVRRLSKKTTDDSPKDQG